MPTDQTQPGEAPASPSSPHAARWLTKGVWGIGLASFLADVGHEVPTALFGQFRDNYARSPCCGPWPDRRTR